MYKVNHKPTSNVAKVIIYLMTMLVNLALIGLTAWLFKESGSLWSLLTLMFMLGIKMGDDD